jgi:hypothetical protein
MRYPEFYTPEEIELMRKALECIQVIVENNCLDNKIPVDRHDKNCKWCKIYTLAHAGTSPSCRDSHLAWEKELIALHDSFSEKGLAQKRQ